LEQLELGVGVGVLISPRDLGLKKAIEYSEQYRQNGADLLFDAQFYNPDFTNRWVETYPCREYRIAASTLGKLSDGQLGKLAAALADTSRALTATAVLAPALAYEAGRPDIVALNARMFSAARSVGNDLGIPTIATVVLGRSATSAEGPLSDALSAATKLDADGYYYAYVFGGGRIPSDEDDVRRCCSAVLTLACSGKPVIHAYAGPMALLSPGVGAHAVGVGHSQNLWQFTIERWSDSPSDQGGGGDAPARLFSRGLWGTIIHPDETAQLTAALRAQVDTHSPFVTPWSRWQANKHLVYAIGQEIAELYALPTVRDRAAAARARLQGAVSLHEQIRQSGVLLKDGTDSYQANWDNAMGQVLSDCDGDYDYLDLLG